MLSRRRTDGRLKQTQCTTGAPGDSTRYWLPLCRRLLSDVTVTAPGLYSAMTWYILSCETAKLDRGIDCAVGHRRTLGRGPRP